VILTDGYVALLPSLSFGLDIRLGESRHQRRGITMMWIESGHRIGDVRADMRICTVALGVLQQGFRPVRSTVPRRGCSPHAAYRTHRGMEPSPRSRFRFPKARGEDDIPILRAGSWAGTGRMALYHG